MARGAITCCLRDYLLREVQLPRGLRLLHAFTMVLNFMRDARDVIGGDR